MQNAKCEMQNAKCEMQNAKCKMQNAKCKMQNAECETQNADCDLVIVWGQGAWGLPGWNSWIRWTGPLRAADGLQHMTTSGVTRARWRRGRGAAGADLV